MPDLSVTHIVIIVFAIIVGIVVGWVMRGNRGRQEKAAMNAGWQSQLDAQQLEHQRLVDQNKGLMEQISQYQASNKDAKNRAKELSAAVQEAFARRDELQRDIKDIRSNLEATLSERDQLQSDLAAKSVADGTAEAKDEKIRKLSRELENWQNRLPPLIERFRVRNEEAGQLETDLAAARERIDELEAALQSSIETNETRIEPVRNTTSLTDGRDASNDPEEDDPDDAEEVNIRDEIDDAVEDDDDFDDMVAAGSSENDDSIEDGADDLADTDAANDEPGLHGLRDNLKKIKGVGPAIEKTLNEMGIFRYQQIADMSEYDIDRIARRLRGFRSRIYREDWIGQARQLLDLAAQA